MTSDRLYTTLERWFSRKTSNSGIRRVADLQVAVTSDIGLVREENQDRVAAMRFQDADGSTLVVVALGDGMGGMRDGAACAAMTLAKFFSDFAMSRGSDYGGRLLHAVRAANDTVHMRYRGGGGATLSAVLVGEFGKVFAVNVGDSRIYRVGRRLLRQITIDDTLAGQLSHRGEGLHRSNELLQFVGIGPEIEPHVFETEGAFGESGLLLTSDGVHFLPRESMEAVLSHAPEPALGMKRLVDLAKWCGGHDNASAALITALPPSSSGERSEDSVSVDVWDPFGELQCLILGAERQKAHDSPAPRADVAPSATAVLKKNKSPRKKLEKGVEHSPREVKDRSRDKPKVAARSESTIEVQSEPENVTKSEPTHSARTEAKDEAGKAADDGTEMESKNESKLEEKGGGKDANKPDAPQLIIDFPNKTPGQS